MRGSFCLLSISSFPPFLPHFRLVKFGVLGLFCPFLNTIFSCFCFGGYTFGSYSGYPQKFTISLNKQSQILASDPPANDPRTLTLITSPLPLLSSILLSPKLDSILLHSQNLVTFTIMVPVSLFTFSFCIGDLPSGVIFLLLERKCFEDKYSVSENY